MTPCSHRLRAALVAAMLAAGLLGCGEDQEPSTTVESEQEEAVPGEPGAPEPSPDPQPEDAEDTDEEAMGDADGGDGTATRGDGD